MKKKKPDPAPYQQPIIIEKEPESASEGKNSKVRLNDFAEILEHADKQRDVKFKAHLKEYVRPITIRHGVFEFSAPEEAPQLLPNLISKTLHEWTGERWTVTLQADKGGMTVNEQAAAQREALLSDASQDEEVNAILVEFPGAQIVDVRLNLSPEAEDEPEFIELEDKQDEA